MERRGGSLNKEVEWRQWYSGTRGGDNGVVERRGGGSLNKEVEWRQWYSGTQGGEV